MGFCPQRRYQVGETFGRTTSRLLTDETVASSGRLILATTDPALGKSVQNFRDKRTDIVRARQTSWGDQKFTEHMIPGYTGFVPKHQNYFGKKYAENAVEAISDFEVSQRQNNQRIAEIRLSNALKNSNMEKKSNDLSFPDITNRYLTPLEPVTNAQIQFSDRSPKPPVSPYDMQNNNPKKYFMSGYTGFVPKIQNYLGSGYPVMSHRALTDFKDTQKRLVRASVEPFMLVRDAPPNKDIKPIYPVESGIIPKYTGHIPGERFRFGKTFGFSTNNVMKRNPKDYDRSMFCCT
jgi:hypothetical protein